MNHVRLESVERVSHLHKIMHNACFTRAHFATIITTQCEGKDFKILYTVLTIYSEFLRSQINILLNVRYTTK